MSSIHLNYQAYSLDNYDLDIYEIGACLITGCSGIPYALRHFNKSNEDSDYSLGHKIIGVLECCPIIGGITALIERISVFVFSYFNLSSQPKISGKNGKANEINMGNVVDELPVRALSNATALEFVAYANPSIRSLRGLTEEEVQEFLNRGGRINIASEDKINEQRILLNKDIEVITGCMSGINRSQVAAGVMEQMGLAVNGVLAGGDSAMNLELQWGMMGNPNDEYTPNFAQVFGRPKLNQIGFDVNHDDIGAAQSYFQNYIDQLSPTHFITFSNSGPAALRRLLAREGSLEGFTITHFSSNDEIAHPPGGMQYHSPEAYAAFGEKIRRCFVVQ